MTVRTLIEVSADDAHDHDRQLRAVLEKIGYEPKPTSDYVNWMRDLHEVLDEHEINIRELIKEKQKKRFDDRGFA